LSDYDRDGRQRLYVTRTVPPAGADPRIAGAGATLLARDTIDGLSNVQHLTGLGAVASAEAAGGLDGKRIAIDGYEINGPAVAAAAADRGAVVAAISTADGAAVNETGFDVAGLREAWAAHGAGMLGDLRRIHRIRITRTARLAQRRHVIDVDSQRYRIAHFRLIICWYTSRDFSFFPCKLKSIVLRSTVLASRNTSRDS